MRRIICLITAMLICLSVAGPVLAAEEFVPSIGYKDHPEVVPGEDGSAAELVSGDGEVIDPVPGGCLVVTPVSEVGTSEEIPEEAREILEEVYEELTNGSMTLPFENPDEMVIRDLFDASLICDDGHKERLAEEGVYIRITFDLGIAPGVDVVVMTYIDGVWAPIYSVVNNGDGTVTCVFEEICPIVFAVRSNVYDAPAQTGDEIGQSMGIWVALMAVSAAALVCLVVFRRKVMR